jgi:hypothetical protein
VAYLALFISLGGTSYAAVSLAKNSVLSKHIKNGQVKRVDLAANAVNSAKVGDGTLLAQDFAPGQLPKGEKGDTGAAGAAGATNVVMRVAEGSASGGGNNAPFDTTTGKWTGDGGAGATFVFCNEGERVVGGGYTSEGRGFIVTENAPYPAANGAAPIGWLVEVVSTTNEASPALKPWVLCAKP